MLLWLSLLFLLVHVTLQGHEYAVLSAFSSSSSSCPFFLLLYPSFLSNTAGQSKPINILNGGATWVYNEETKKGGNLMGYGEITNVANGFNALVFLLLAHSELRFFFLPWWRRYKYVDGVGGSWSRVGRDPEVVRY